MKTLHLYAFAALLVASPGCGSSAPSSTPTGSTGGSDGSISIPDSSLPEASSTPARDSSGPAPANGEDSSGSALPTGQDASTSGSPGGGVDAAQGPVDSGLGTGGDAAASGGCAGLALCDDFELDTVGGPPSASLWTLVGLAGCSGTGNPSAPQVYPITIDGSQHHGDTKSAKVVGGDSCGPFMVNTSAFAALAGGEVYGRYWMHLSDTAMTFDHAAFMALGLLRDGGAGLSVGAQDSYIQLASEGAGGATNTFMWQTDDGNVLPEKNSMGAAESTYVAATGFTCIEFHTSSSGKAIEVWVNGTTVAGLTSPPVPSAGTQWTPPSPLAPTSFGLGWVLFSGEQLTAWYDDVALSTTRIGCN
ncbi:MAG: hypothetical protein WBY94_20625 [Polyangiaceae bacterium]